MDPWTTSVQSFDLDVVGVAAVVFFGVVVAFCQFLFGGRGVGGSEVQAKLLIYHALGTR